MISLLKFLYFVLDGVLGLLVLALIINAVMSWLVAFDVVNYRNRFVASIGSVLDAITRPLLAPFQRIVPPLGGVDITPILAILVIQGVRAYLLPGAFNALLGLAY